MRVLGNVAVLAAAGLLVGCGLRPDHQVGRSAAGSTTPSSRVVPWVDRPAPPYIQPPPRKFRTDARPCRAADLRVMPGRIGVGLGHTNVEVAFTNRSPSPCLLLGYPTVAGISKAGIVTPLRAWHGSYFGDPGPPANIAPGQTAAVNISGGEACQAAQGGGRRDYPRLRIGLPGGGSVSPARLPFDAICGVSVSQFGVPADAPGPQPSSPLTARITAPATVRPGAILLYTVTLTNHTARAYSLRPCPAYEEFAVASPSGRDTPPGSGNVIKDYYLNCHAVHRITARGSVTYQMRLRIPVGFPVGVPVKFGWDLQGPAGLGASAPLRVVG
jgi:hypothetical protein